MADTKISALTELAARPALNDLIPMVDISDVTMAASGTTKKIQYSNLASDLLSKLTQAEVAVTGATTATIDRMHVCSGTTADYTVTLPAVAGNAGRLIGFRMSSALTRMVTIDGNASELINGVATRIMWANESAILLCDGTGWSKISGETIPMQCKLTRNTVQSIPSATTTKVNLNVSVYDVGALGSTANGRIILRRPGIWSVIASAEMWGIPAGGYLEVEVWLNGTFQYYYYDWNGGGGTSAVAPAVTITHQYTSPTDFLELHLLHSALVSLDTETTAFGKPQMAVYELPLW